MSTTDADAIPVLGEPDPRNRFLWNSYYEAVGPRYDRPLRGVISRPGAHDVGLYRDNVDARFADLVDRLDDDLRWLNNRPVSKLYAGEVRA